MASYQYCNEFSNEASYEVNCEDRKYYNQNMSGGCTQNKPKPNYQGQNMTNFTQNKPNCYAQNMTNHGTQNKPYPKPNCQPKPQQALFGGSANAYGGGTYHAGQQAPSGPAANAYGGTYHAGQHAPSGPANAYGGTYNAGQHAPSGPASAYGGIYHAGQQSPSGCVGSGYRKRNDGHGHMFNNGRNGAAGGCTTKHRHGRTGCRQRKHGSDSECESGSESDSDSDNDC